MEFFFGIIKGGEWHPTVKEGNPAAWLVVVGLLGAACFSFWLANRFSRRGPTSIAYTHSWSWILASLLFLGFAACKQLELHLELLGFLKGQAKNGGWYDYRYQLAGSVGSLGILAG